MSYRDILRRAEGVRKSYGRRLLLYSFTLALGLFVGAFWQTSIYQRCSLPPQNAAENEQASYANQEHCAADHVSVFSVAGDVGYLLDRSASALTALATLAIAWFTIQLSEATGTQAALTRAALRLTRYASDQQSSDMRASLTIAADNAVAARDGALASRDSADTAKLALVASERAYVHYSGMKWISHPREGTGEIFWRIRPWWTNTGNTPTRRLVITIRYVLADAPLPPTYDFSVAPVAPIAPATIYPKGFLESGIHDLDGAVLQTIKDGSMHLYVAGVATYHDVFADTPERITKFCVYAANVTGDPTEGWHNPNNIVDIMFGHFGPHNCSDEDCEIQA